MLEALSVCIPSSVTFVSVELVPLTHQVRTGQSLNREKITGRSNRTAAEKPARGLEHTTDALQLKTFVLFLKFV